ncbi:DedA family protein [Frigidibacter sp. ROC022]|uniref:DedA family protein n=1 Tax=Frigidibacter sp. ROC022 TaxID=2971796 RepID=UPI00215A96D6|nr:VTT domain-containing protein [Frigidibacter sp. ROC022]MCR8725900.1 VTT domain-containing protein [Frigidibacter sp. ROC022]
MAISTDTISQLIQAHGLLLLFPLSVVEGPIVSVGAGWMAKLGLVSFGWAYVILILGDLIGDALHYAAGRSGLRLFPERWRKRLGIDSAAMQALVNHFEVRGGRTLILAKLTHSLGFAALIASGVARMPFLPFLWFNFLGTLPKTLAFMLLGYAMGHAQTLISTWLWRGSLVVFVLGVVALIWFLRHRAQRS